MRRSIGDCVIRETRDEVGDLVEIAGPDGRPFARGVSRASASEAATVLGRRSADLPEGAVTLLVHRDDLVLLP